MTTNIRSQTIGHAKSYPKLWFVLNARSNYSSEVFYSCFGDVAYMEVIFRTVLTKAFASKIGTDM